MFYNMGPSISEWYNSVSRMHLDTYQVMISAEKIMADLNEKKVPKDYAIVLLCGDGKVSSKIFIELEKAAYTNVYVIDGGHQQMVTERSQL